MPTTQPSPPRLVNPKTQQRFVLLPEEQYAQLAAYDAGPWPDEERDLLRAGDESVQSPFNFDEFAEVRGLAAEISFYPAVGSC